MIEEPKYNPLPVAKEETFKVILTKDEAILIQKIRETMFGSVTIHLSGGKIYRFETVSSELTKDKKGEAITIAYEVIKN